MLADIGFAFLSVFVVIAAMVVRPHRATCPVGWHHEGVRPSGSFVCEQNAIGGTNDLNDHADTATYPPGELHGSIYCTGGTLPIVVSERVVGCQRGVYQ